MSLTEKLIEYPLNKKSFIQGWYIPKYICDEIIDYMNQNYKLYQEGFSVDGINKKVKESKDIFINTKNSTKTFYNYRVYLKKCLDEYIKEYNNIKVNFEVIEDYNLQSYPVGGGFKQWHCENNFDKSTYKRVLVFMTYLNDVEDGGETEFFYQKIKVKPRKGLTLIWPSGWTHTHRGVPSMSEEKYVLTGWYQFVN